MVSEINNSDENIKHTPEDFLVKLLGNLYPKPETPKSDNTNNIAIRAKNYQEPISQEIVAHDTRLITPTPIILNNQDKTISLLEQLIAGQNNLSKQINDTENNLTNIGIGSAESIAQQMANNHAEVMNGQAEIKNVIVNVYDSVAELSTQLNISLGELFSHLNYISDTLKKGLDESNESSIEIFQAIMELNKEQKTNFKDFNHNLNENIGLLIGGMIKPEVIFGNGCKWLGNQLSVKGNYEIIVNTNSTVPYWVTSVTLNNQPEKLTINNKVSPQHYETITERVNGDEITKYVYNPDKPVLITSKDGKPALKVLFWPVESNTIEAPSFNMTVKIINNGEEYNTSVPIYADRVTGYSKITEAKHYLSLIGKELIKKVPMVKGFIEEKTKK